MTNSANLIEDMMNSAKKKHDRNGNAVYTINLEPLFDAGFIIGDIRKQAKAQTIRLVKNDSHMSIQSANLRFSLNTLLTGLASTN